MKQNVYRENKIITNDLSRISIFPVRRVGRGRTPNKRQPTRAAQERLNQKYRENRIIDTVHLNFSEGDYILHLKYDKTMIEQRTGNQRRGALTDMETEATAEQARAILSAYLRRLKRLMKAKGLDCAGFKYYGGTYVGRLSGRVHHHIYLHAVGLTMDEIVQSWNTGSCSISPLEFNESDGVTGSCLYIARQMRTNPTAHFITGSRNLIRPCKEGKNKNIYQNDQHIRYKDVMHLVANPDDYGYAARMYPGWACSGIEIAYTTDQQTGEVELPPFGIFITLKLYRPKEHFVKNRRSGT